MIEGVIETIAIICMIPIVFFSGFLFFSCLVKEEDCEIRKNRKESLNEV